MRYARSAPDRRCLLRRGTRVFGSHQHTRRDDAAAARRRGAVRDQRSAMFMRVASAARGVDATTYAALSRRDERAAVARQDGAPSRERAHHQVCCALLRARHASAT